MLSAAALLYLIKGTISLTLSETVISASLLFIGSILPDIDHKNSYIHRAVKSGLSISTGILTIVFLPTDIQTKILSGIAGFSIVYLTISKIKMKHRGFTHSFSFAAILSSTAFTLGILFTSSFAPGIALAVGILSHLVLDSELKLR